MRPCLKKEKQENENVYKSVKVCNINLYIGTAIVSKVLYERADQRGMSTNITGLGEGRTRRRGRNDGKKLFNNEDLLF